MEVDAVAYDGDVVEIGDIEKKGGDGFAKFEEDGVENEREQVATASYGHRYPRPARLKVASVEVSRAAALEGPMRRF